MARGTMTESQDCPPSIALQPKPIYGFDPFIFPARVVGGPLFKHEYDYGTETVGNVLFGVAGTEFDSSGGELAALLAGAEDGNHSRITGHAAIAAKTIASTVTQKLGVAVQWGFFSSRCRLASKMASSGMLRRFFIERDKGPIHPNGRRCRT